MIQPTIYILQVLRKMFFWYKNNTIIIFVYLFVKISANITILTGIVTHIAFAVSVKVSVILIYLFINLFLAYRSALKPIQCVSSATPGNHCGARPLVGLCVLIDKVWPSVARLSHTLVIVGGSQLRPPVTRGPLWDKGQRMERILICRDELILTGSMHTFYTWEAAYKGAAARPVVFLSLWKHVFNMFLFWQS